MKKKIAKIMLMCLVVLSSANPLYVKAETVTDIVIPYYINLYKAEANLSLNGTQANVETKVLTKNKQDLSVVMKLQKKSGTSWTTIKTWTENKEDSMILNVNKTHTISSGSYRVQSTVSAGNETVTVTSTIKTY